MRLNNMIFDSVLPHFGAICPFSIIHALFRSTGELSITVVGFGFDLLRALITHEMIQYYANSTIFPERSFHGHLSVATDAFVFVQLIWLSLFGSFDFVPDT